MNRYYIKRFLDEVRRRIPLDQWFGKGYAFPPLRIDIELLHNCNLQCEMCSFVPGNEINKAFSNKLRSYHEKIEDYPSLEEWNIFFKQVSKFSPTINLSGGEPLLHPEFFEILKIIKNYKLITTMTTNATLIDDIKAKDLVLSGIESLVISIDGDEETHDNIRKIKGSFNNTINGIKLLKKYKKEYHSSTPRIVINSTISWLNFNDLSFAEELFTEIKPYKWNFSHLFLGNGDYVEKSIDKLYKPRDDLDALNKFYHLVDVNTLYHEIQKLKKGKYGKHISFLPHLNYEKLKIFYEKPEIPVRKKCHYPYYSCVVQGDGSIITCMYYKMGTIRDDFKKLWNSQNYKEFRMHLKKGLFAKCSRCCGLYE